MRVAHSVLVVYDDSLAVPPEISSVTGVVRFGDMLRRRQRLSSTVQTLSEHAGLSGMLHARTSTDLSGIADAVRRYPADMLYLLLPSNLAPTASNSDAVLFLKKLRYLTEPVGLAQADGSTGAYLIDREGLLNYVAECELGMGDRDRYLREYAAQVPPVEEALRLADLRELGVTLEFLSGSFSARHFNRIAHDRYDVVKQSPNVDKIRREYAFFGFLPEVMQPFFLQPFSYREDEAGASYRMRRLFVPDLAVQWVHSAFTEAQFDQLLGHLFHYLGSRPRRDVGRKAAQRTATALYVDKVQARIDQLLGLQVGRDMDAVLRAGGIAGGVGALFERHVEAYSRVSRRRSEPQMCVSHGDPCFSNILYSPSTQTFQLIDPRGADQEDEIYSDVYYDVAKLSHSVLGSYDFIVAGQFELVHEEDLALSLRIDDDAPASLRPRFVQELSRNGFDVDLVRACEASLFLSMLPLHIDNPKRLAAFALRARDILVELDA